LSAGIIRYGDRFRLCHSGRKRGSTPLYLISAEKGGRQYYPRVGSIADAVLLVFAGGKTGEPVSSRASIQIMTTETVVGDANTIGSFKGDHYLYYHLPGQPEQVWQIDAVGNSSDGKLHAGEKFSLISRDDSNRRVGQDPAQPDYLTASFAVPGYWHVELL
jgi:hypothetical protein